MKSTYHPSASSLHPTSSAPRPVSLPGGWFVWLIERLLAGARRVHARRSALPGVWRQGGLALAGAALALSLSGIPVGAAPLAAPQSEILVTTTVVAPIDDAECGLVEAIVAANSDTAYFGCTAGSGADTIILAGTTYNFTAPYGGVDDALPTITSAITIEGNGSTIQRTGGPNFRLIRVTAGTLTLNDSTLSGGLLSSPRLGAGLLAQNNSAVTINNSTFSGNDGYVGGGIAATLNSSVTVGNSTMSGNTALSAGGGLSIERTSSLILSNSLVSNNSSTANGAGLYSGQSSVVTINHSTISDNASTLGGGGIAAFESNVAIDSSVISGNSALGSGGGVVIGFGGTSAVEITNSTISGNTAGSDGGGLRVSRASAWTVSDTTLTGNVATNGGGVSVVDSTAAITLEASVVSGNRATSSGDEIDNNGTATSLGLNVLGDAGETGPEAFDNFTPLASDYVATSDQQNVTLGGILHTDGSGTPLLANNGGPTKTIALVAGSPAIDLAPTGPTIDQRGFARPVDGNGNPSATEYDAGAFEYNGAPTAVTLSAMTVQSGGGRSAGPLALLIGLLTLLGFKHRRR